MGDQSTRRRVKLYALNAERQWDDRGTGYVTSSYVEKLQGKLLPGNAALLNSLSWRRTSRVGQNR